MSTTTSSSTDIPLALESAAASHLGKVREENQDRLAHATTPLGELFIVADGMGGHRGGARAAEMTIEGMVRRLGEAASEGSAAELLQRAGAETNDEIYRAASSGDPETERMGATAVMALVSGATFWIAHAGDSRAYLFRRGELSRLTRDHTPVQRLVEHRILTEAEARNHPHASVVSRGFGQEAPLELEVASPRELEVGDRLLLCSDGLSAHVDDAEIARVLGSSTEVGAAAERLIELSLEAGGGDNVSLHLLELAEPALPDTRPSTTSGPTLWWLLVIVALAVVVALVLVLR